MIKVTDLLTKQEVIVDDSKKKMTDFGLLEHSGRWKTMGLSCYPTSGYLNDWFNDTAILTRWLHEQIR